MEAAEKVEQRQVEQVEQKVKSDPGAATRISRGPERAQAGDSPPIPSSPIADALGRDCASVRDRCGRWRRLTPLSIGDLMELEQEFGPRSEWTKAKLSSARFWAAALWRSMRREGLPWERARRREWALSRALAAELVAVGSDGFAAVDLFGCERALAPLTLADLVRLEEFVGAPFVEWAGRPISDNAFYSLYLWLSLRKAGRSPEVLVDEDEATSGRGGAVTEAEARDLYDVALAEDPRFGLLVDGGVVADVINAFSAVMHRGGVRVRMQGEEAAADPTPSTPATSTPAPAAEAEAEATA